MNSLKLNIISYVLLFNLFIIDCWNRSALIYNAPRRTLDQWKRHMMQIDSNGQFNGQWIFNAAILTAYKINEKDIYFGNDLNGNDIVSCLDKFFNDSIQLDNAINELKSKYPLKNKIQISIGVPYLSTKIRNLQLPGIDKSLDMSIFEDRLTAAKWYLNETTKRSQNSNWNNLQLYGAYYHREDASDAYGDPQFIIEFNKEAHNRNIKTVWVPYYNAPNAWKCKEIGFDICIVQPSYAFVSPIDIGDVNAGRLYGTGYKSLDKMQAYEYELRGLGEHKVEYWISHQYLSIAQITGSSKYPQTYFVGQDPDLFDAIVNQSSTGYSWSAYKDLTYYLLEKIIPNFEIDIPLNLNYIGNNTAQIIWTPNSPLQNLNSIRLDFKDVNMTVLWRGRVSVSVDGPSGIRNSYSQRTGIDDINTNYSSVQVPIQYCKTISQTTNCNTTVTKVIINITRENGSEWPISQRLVAAIYEPLITANGNYESISSSNRNLDNGPYSDSKETHLGFYSGKLTDGQKSDSWFWSGVMGWDLRDGRFSVTIDLQKSFKISMVKVYTHFDQSAGINWPRMLSVLSHSTCAPVAKGISDQSCQPEYSFNNLQLTTKNLSRIELSGVYSVPISNITSRYLTITGICSAWCLFDEFEVLDTSNSIVSVNKRYHLTPKPTYSLGSDKRKPDYGDNSRNLVDGVISDDFYGSMVTGINASEIDYIQTIFPNPQKVSNIIIWLTKAQPSWGIYLPQKVSIQWRNGAFQWQNAIDVTPQDCGFSPCAKLVIGLTSITGINASFPRTGWGGWYMITEISSL